MSSEIESDVNQERLLARTLMELRQVFTRAKLLLPSLNLQQILMLAGAVEQAKTDGMRVKPKPTVVVAGFDGLHVPVVRNSLTVTIDKKKVHVAVAAAKAITEKGPLSVRELLDTFEAKGWKLNSKSSYPMQIVRNVLQRHDDHFAASTDGGVVKFRIKEPKAKAAKDENHPKETKEKKTPWRAQKDARAEARDAIVKTLVTVREPITIAALAEKMGRPNGAGIVPVMISLVEHGAVKKIERGGETLWDPKPDKLKEYSKANSTAFTKEHVSLLNGVSN